MTGFLDGHTLRVRCSNCDRKNCQTIAWLKPHKSMSCVRCGATITLEPTELINEIKRVETMLDTFARSIGKH